jgi:hypothetical protein
MIAGVAVTSAATVWIVHAVRPGLAATATAAATAAAAAKPQPG